MGVLTPYEFLPETFIFDQEDMFHVTIGNYSIIDYVVEIINQAEYVDRLLISTWTIGIRQVEKICEIKNEGRINDFKVFIDKSFGSRNPHYLNFLNEKVGAENVRMAKNHSKIIFMDIMPTPVVMTTSMNFNKNTRCEFVHFSFDKNLCGHIDKMFRWWFDETDIDGKNWACGVHLHTSNLEDYAEYLDGEADA